MSGALDREMTEEYQLVVVAMDSANDPGNVQQVRVHTSIYTA